MDKQNRLMLWAVAVVPLVGAILAIIPPQERLKGGIDIVGGFSLLYEIDTTGLSSDEVRAQGGLANRVKEILQRRVDPNAQLNLIWIPVGSTRLEIQMPHPPQRALERRKAYDEALQAVRAKGVSRLEVELALSEPAEVRSAALDKLSQGVPERKERLAAVVTAYDAYKPLVGSDDVDAEYAARKDYEAALRELLDTSLEATRLTDVLSLANLKERSEQLGRLKSQFPSYKDEIAEAEARYDDWASQKAALEDPSDLKRLLRGAGVLEFRILADRDAQNPTMIQSDEAALRQPIAPWVDQLHTRGPRPKAGDRFAWFPVENIAAFLNVDTEEEVERTAETSSTIVSQYAGRWYTLMHTDRKYSMLHTSDQKWKLTSALPSIDENGRPCVAFELDARGGSQFSRLTGENKGRQLTIMLDDAAMSAATIESQIWTRGRISGSSFTQEKVSELVQILEAGSLPGRLKETPLMEKNIGPSLGRANRAQGMRAATVGMIIVAIFMLIYYRFAGLVADLALMMNLLLVLGIMATMEATFTLPGIAGLILTVGMAVDANVLIFERIREERERGTAFKRAMKIGYDKALSTIVDANLTTLITCVVLGYLGSEEVKGFAMALGFGIVTSMFTALFVSRLIFSTMHDIGWLRDLKMMKLVGRPSIDWLSLRSKFWPASLTLSIIGMIAFATASKTDPESVYDIEFLGGTSVQIELKDDVTLNDEEVRRRITSADAEKSSVRWLKDAADALERATVSAGASQTEFVVTSETLSSEQIAALMMTKARGRLTALVDQLEQGGVQGEGNTARFNVKLESGVNLDAFRTAVADSVAYARKAADLLAGARVQTVHDIEESATETPATAFEIVTVETNKQLVQEAILASLGDELDVQQSVNFSLVTDDGHPEGFFPIEENAHYLSEVIDTNAAYDIRRYKGGLVLAFDELNPPQTVESIQRRIREIRLQPGFDQYKWRNYAVFGLDRATEAANGQETFTKIALAVVDEELPFFEDTEGRWRDTVAIPELEQATEALRSEKALRKVVQFAPQIADQVKNQAVLAVAVALASIVAYVWIRFGSMQFGLAAIVALVHDVCITLGLMTLSDFFHGGAIGSLLLIESFKIDLPMIAALLTIIGYSLNDTIVVFDRIRENRGKMRTLNAQIINQSINQTLSRTVLTSATTWMVVVILYFMGGRGVHGFAYALVAGIFIGTYSSVGIATPLLYRPRVLHIVVYVLAALGLLGAVAVAGAGTTAMIICGVIVVALLVWVIMRELRSSKDWGSLVSSSPA